MVYLENILVCVHFLSKQANVTQCLCFIMQLFRLKFLSILYTQTVL